MKAVLVIITAIAFGISCVTGYYLETDMSYGMMIMFGIGDMCVFVLLYRVFFRVFHMKKTACLRGVGGVKQKIVYLTEIHL
ncbi:MAG: hypothetical protein HFG46_08895 [Clostridium sp.]|nr:hypothetical protein [Clostridium sp.]